MKFNITLVHNESGPYVIDTDEVELPCRVEWRDDPNTSRWASVAVETLGMLNKVIMGLLADEPDVWDIRVPGAMK